MKLNQLIIDGQRISPTLSEGTKNYLVDIDGTICEDIPNEEPLRMVDAKIFPNSLETINKWYEDGHVITFFTSRTESHREVTTNWLNKHGFKYHGLLMGKPRGGNYAIIDNHLFQAYHYTGDWESIKIDSDNNVHNYSPIPKNS